MEPNQAAPEQSTISEKDRNNFVNLPPDQLEQYQLEQDESRLIMNKRRKRIAPIEEINLDDCFSEHQKEFIMSLKRQRRDGPLSDQTATSETSITPMKQMSVEE
jgi:hypothetical protein